MTERRLKVAILGATGLVGQRLVRMLDAHPFFEVGAVVASDRSAGSIYGEICAWRLSEPIPKRVAAMRIQPCHPPVECDLAISSLPASVARSVEPAYAASGIPVVSNSSALRAESDVPLVIPEINPDHLELIDEQRRSRRWSRGFVVTNPNCSAIALSLVLAPLHRAFGIDAVAVTTMQAVSGAGYPGLSSVDLVDNVIPFIDGEEEKLASEPLKILGSLDDGKVTEARFRVGAQCNRVPVLEGHLASVRIVLDNRVSPEDAAAALASFQGAPQRLRLPTAPEQPIVVSELRDRPQPRLDREVERGMSIVVGRIARDAVSDLKLTILGNNLVRGAAGAALLNAELLVAHGYLDVDSPVGNVGATLAR